MTDALAHRGPDDAGEWSDREAGIGLGHRRLAIVDLSAEGHQPMQSACGRYHIAFNGEIYNFPALRGRLEGLGHHFRGHSDTEVLLAAIAQWSFEPALRLLDGMFAIALWDAEQRALFLARDRLGEKPLYYGVFDGAFLFGSELKALRAHSAFELRLDRAALELFTRYSYVPGPRSIFERVWKLPAGAFLRVDPTERRAPSPQRYWSALEAVRRGRTEPFRGSLVEASQLLEEKLRASVESRMLADVPLGAFLSGGIDSSTVVALMQRASTKPIRTFTIGFAERAFDEADWARQVASHLGTDHTEVRVTPAEVRNVIPRLPAIYDEPFADQSQLPTCILAEITRRHVTVALSGDGGDELFGGNRRYVWARTLERRLGRVPYAVRAAGAIAAAAAHWGTRGFSTLSTMLDRAKGARRLVEALRKTSEILRLRDNEAIYRRTLSFWQDPRSILTDYPSAPDPMLEAMEELDGELLERMTYADTITYLPDDILVKVDRASMHVALEVRVPFLDHTLVEFAASLPSSFKVRGADTKIALKQVLERHLPRSFFERPKQGFGAPIAEWLRGPLRAWAEDLLHGSALRRQGLFRPEPIEQALRDHQSGRRDRDGELWTILMFEAWYAEVVEGGGASRSSADVGAPATSAA